MYHILIDTTTTIIIFHSIYAVVGEVRFCVHKQGNTAKSFANTGTHQDAEYILQHVIYVQRYLRIGVPVCWLERSIVVRSQV